MEKRIFCCLMLIIDIMVCMGQTFRVHQVVRGESLEYIANKYGITTDEIKQHNTLLDKYFYVGQKLNIPIKEPPKIEHTASTYTSSSWKESKPVREKRHNNGWKQFWGGVASAFVDGAAGYGQPMMYNPYPYQGGGNMDYLLDPNYTLMQMQPQIAQMQARMAEEWKATQESQQYLRSMQNKWQSFPQGTGGWNNMPVVSGTPVFIPESESSIGTIGTTSSYSNSSSGAVCKTCNGGGKCNSCHGSGIRTDNLFAAGQNPTAKCGVCGGSGICVICHGSGRK